MTLEMATDQHRVLNIRRTLDFILWKMRSCWSVARAKIFKTVWFSLLFLKLLQLVLYFLQNKVQMVYFGTQRLHSQASAYLFSIIGLLPAWTLHFSQIGLRAVPWIGHDDSCFDVCLSAYCLPCEETLPLSSQGHWLCFRGSSLCSESALCLVLSPFPSLATLYSSHGVLEHVAFF